MLLYNPDTEFYNISKLGKFFMILYFDYFLFF